jgi:uncharacterized membrane protein (UPF0127 family)
MHYSPAVTRSAVLALFAFLAFAVPTAAQEMEEAPLTIETDEGRFEYSVELALTGEERATGLMNREEMAEDHGMLFRFESPRPVTMWMKNTLIPLDMIFIRRDGTVAGFHENAEPLSLETIAAPEPVLYVLELNGGKADEMGLEEGDVVSHPVIEAGKD